ncbi:MAG TPA: efflux RND transporter periplasmic adaptor subunit [Candidatus Paceibacterota bacterium]
MKIFSRAKKFAVSHKILSAIIIVVLAGAGYGIYRNSSGSEAQTRYVLGKVSNGTLVSSVTGTGQVAASEQTNITPNVSGDEITSILVKAGDEVVKGQAIAYIDSTAATKAVSNAQLSYESAVLEYEKAEKENRAQQSDSSTSDIKKAYETGYNTLANAFIDLPAIFMGVNDIYYTPAHSPYFSDNNLNIRAGQIAVNYKLQAGVTFDQAKRDYEKAFVEYKALSPNSSPEKISSLLESTQSILKQLLSSLSGTYSTIEYVNDKYTSAAPSEMASDKSQLSGYISKVNSNSSSVQNAITGIENAQDSSTTSDLGMRSADLAKSKAADALSDAKTALADHVVRAPYSGLIAKVSGKVGDKASAGTAIATIISKDMLVSITLNEIDAAKVKNGDKVTLKFDALDDLTLQGHVSNVDLVGTVSQGVVSYSVEIAFDQNDARVKPGMTVNAEMVSSSKSNVLLVPSSAVKTTGGKSYVQVMSGGNPVDKEVTIGSSDDFSVEILSGLAEGDQIIARTITTTATAAQSSSLLNGLTNRNRNGANSGTRVMTGNATFSAPAGATSGGSFQQVQVITR